MKKKIIKHLKDDIKTFKKESSEDKELIKELKGKKVRKKSAKIPAKKSSKPKLKGRKK